MKVLVTGGAGYVGSHTVKALLRRGHEVVVLDDLRTGHAAAVPAGVPLLRHTIGQTTGVEGAGVAPAAESLAVLLREHRVEGVLHFAASCYVGESMEQPLPYYENNVVATLRLVEACIATGVFAFVFSSSCATYGVPATVPIDEEAPQRPVNPYGESKRVAETILRDAARAHGLRPVFLRYFNAAGADPEGELGEDHRPETHLVPNAIRAALGRVDALDVYGADYPTSDGTCVRDYVHVTDLADAHLLALERAAAGASLEAFNLGNGRGFSVRQVVDAVSAVAGRAVPTRARPRRPGDPPVLVAESRRAREVLGWRPRHAELRAIVETALRWMEVHPHGYGPGGVSAGDASAGKRQDDGGGRGGNGG